MGFWDFFLKEDKKVKVAASERHTAPAVNFNSGMEQVRELNGNVKVFVPKNFEEIAEIIGVLSLGKPAIVKMKELNDATAQRALDLLSGAIYALRGGLYLIDTGIYVFTPVD